MDRVKKDEKITVADEVREVLNELINTDPRQRKISIQGLARKSGVNKTTIYTFARGNMISYTALEKIAGALGLTLGVVAKNDNDSEEYKEAA